MNLRDKCHDLIDKISDAELSDVYSALLSICEFKSGKIKIAYVETNVRPEFPICYDEYDE